MGFFFVVPFEDLELETVEFACFEVTWFEEEEACTSGEALDL